MKCGSWCLFCATSSGLGASPRGGGREWDTELLSPGHLSPPCWVRRSDTFTAVYHWVLGWSFSLYIPCSPPSRCSGTSFPDKVAPRPTLWISENFMASTHTHTHWILSLLLITCHNSNRLSFPVSISCTRDTWLICIHPYVFSTINFLNKCDLLKVLLCFSGKETVNKNGRK